MDVPHGVSNIVIGVNKLPFFFLACVLVESSILQRRNRSPPPPSLLNRRITHTTRRARVMLKELFRPVIPIINLQKSSLTTPLFTPLSRSLHTTIMSLGKKVTLNTGAQIP